MEENYIKTSNYRYERKSFITELSIYEVENLVKLHPDIFSEIYYKRVINNIYFDSYNLINFRENVDGVTDRVKIRIRWYGNLFGYIEKPILEIKIKKGLLGKKISVPIKPFSFKNEINISDILKSIEYLEEFLLIDLKSIKPSLVNRYARKYYQSSNKKFRITLDNEQSFISINKRKNTFLNRYFEDRTVI